MGLTIHYQLQSDAKTQGEARQLVEQLRQHALELPLESVGELNELSGDDTDFETLEQGDPRRWLLVQAGEYVVQGDQYYPVKPKQVIAFSTWPGDGCEEANFGLCRYPMTIQVDDREMHTGLSDWSWSSFCKTQYASDPACGGAENFIRCHLSVIRLLDHAANLGILGKVSDEGGFWEKRNAEVLVKEVGEWNQRMADFVGNLKDQFGGEFVAPITEFPDFEYLEAKGRDLRKDE